MARSIETIQSEIITAVRAEPELAQANSTSRRAIWRLWTHVVASAIAFLEQLLDVFRQDMEGIASGAVPGTPAWVQAQVLKFQYDASNPQEVNIINLIPQYPIINTALRIVTRCSVRTDLSNTVNVKVAKSDPPTALSSLEKTALQGYVDTIGFAGINYSVISLDADKLYIAATIYYEGQFSAVIAGSVKESINTYLASLPFDGILKISELEYAIKTTDGVNDVVLTAVRARRDADAFADGTDLVISQQTIARLWNTVAGYVVTETETGQTINDSLTFIAE
jgi:hypothetical protein